VFGCGGPSSELMIVDSVELADGIATCSFGLRYQLIWAQSDIVSETYRSCIGRCETGIDRSIVRLRCCGHRLVIFLVTARGVQELANIHAGVTLVGWDVCSIKSLAIFWSLVQVSQLPWYTRDFARASLELLVSGLDYECLSRRRASHNPRGTKEKVCRNSGDSSSNSETIKALRAHSSHDLYSVFLHHTLTSEYRFESAAFICLLLDVSICR
jgi:hypothetical protein